MVAGPATSTPLAPYTTAVDSSGNLYIADTDNNVIEKVTPSGTLSIIAGVPGHAGAPTPGPATSSNLNYPQGVTVDNSGNVNIADTDNNVIEKVTPAGTLSIIAGVVGHSGAPTPGPATSSNLDYPDGVAVDGSGNVYIADTDNKLIEKVTPSGTLSIIAGVPGHAGGPTPGPATSSYLLLPEGVTVDSSGNVFIADTDNNVIEKVTPSGTLSIIAGVGLYGPPTPGPATSSDLDYPHGVTLDSAGNLYVADTYNDDVEEVFGVASPVPTLISSGSGSTSTGTGVTPKSTVGTASVTAAHVSGRAASNTVNCSGTGACTVTETLTTVKTFRVGHKKKSRRKTVVVGSAIVNVTGGGSQRVIVPLNGTGRALLRAHGKLRATLTVTQGAQILRTQTVTYTQTKPHKKK